MKKIIRFVRRLFNKKKMVPASQGVLIAIKEAEARSFAKQATYEDFIWMANEIKKNSNY